MYYIIHLCSSTGTAKKKINGSTLWRTRKLWITTMYFGCWQHLFDFSVKCKLFITVFVSDRSFVDEYIWKRMTLLENMWRLQWRQICCYIPCKRPRSVSRMEGYVGDAGNWLKRGSLASQNEILKLNCWWNVWLYKNKNLSYDVLCS